MAQVPPTFGQMSGTPPKYHVEYYSEDESDGPVYRWMTEDLSDAEQRTALAALEELVAQLGIAIAGTEFGKHVAPGIVELRLRQTAEELRRRLGREPAQSEDPDLGVSILLRIFFHAYGDRRILVLHGYNKRKNKSKRFQQSQIEVASDRLKRWKAAQAKAEKEHKRQRGRE